MANKSYNWVAIAILGIFFIVGVIAPNVDAFASFSFSRDVSPQSRMDLTSVRPYVVSEIYVDGKSTEVSKCGTGQTDGLNFAPGTRVCYHVKITPTTSSTPHLTKPADLQIFEHQEGTSPCKGKIIDTLTLKSYSGATSTLVGHANVPARSGKYYWAACIAGESSGYEAWFTTSLATVGSRLSLR